MTNEGTVTSIKDVKPGQKNLTVIFIVLDIGKVCYFSFSIVVTLGPKKPIISPFRTDANSVISPALIIDFVSVREFTINSTGFVATKPVAKVTLAC